MNMDNFNQPQNSTLPEQQTATQPCLGCGFELTFKIPAPMIVNLPNLLLMVAHADVVECSRCRKAFQPIISHKTQVIFDVMEVKRQGEEDLIQIPDMDFSKLKIT